MSRKKLRPLIRKRQHKLLLAKTTPLLSGGQWVAALKKAPAVSAQYRPAR